MKPKTKKRNPTDATLRNIRALKKRVEKLEEEVRYWCKLLGRRFVGTLDKEGKK